MFFMHTYVCTGQSQRRKSKYKEQDIEDFNDDQCIQDDLHMEEQVFQLKWAIPTQRKKMAVLKVT